MQYEKPRILTVSAADLLNRLGPARAHEYGHTDERVCYWWQYLAGQCRH